MIAGLIAERVLAAAQADAHVAGEIDRNVSVDSLIVRAHQHSATARRDDRARLGELTGGRVE